MIIYNVTVNIEDSIHDEWLKWIKNHIPQVLATGKFIDARLTKVLVHVLHAPAHIRSVFPCLVQASERTRNHQVQTL